MRTCEGSWTSEEATLSYHSQWKPEQQKQRNCWGHDIGGERLWVSIPDGDKEKNEASKGIVCHIRVNIN
jgi:hypothetical protein